MAPKTLSLQSFREQTETWTALKDFYVSLHARASETKSLFISLTPLSDIIDTISQLQARDPERKLPLHGVPYVAKDNIDAPPHETTAGCPSYARVPSKPAFIVSQLTSAGAILVGKVNMDQFASGLVGTRSPYGAPVNPWNPLYIPGGSSSGSAVAVASGLVVFGLSTDTAGSGRVPAAMNGIVGVKPTKGLLSTSGVVPAAASLDCVGILASNVQDASCVLQIVAAEFDSDNTFSRLPPETSAKAPPIDVIGGSGNDTKLNRFIMDLRRPINPEDGALRIGIPFGKELTFDGDDISNRSFLSATRLLRSLGMSTTEIDFSTFRQAASLLYGGPFVAERFAGVGTFIKENIYKRPDDFDKVVAGIILDSEKHKAWELYNAEQAMRAFVKKAEDEVWAKVDVLVLPSIPRPVTLEEVKQEPLTRNSMLGTYTNFVNLMDYCAVAVPCPSVEETMDVPRGVTFVAPAFGEGLLLRMAKAYEATL